MLEVGTGSRQVGISSAPNVRRDAPRRSQKHDSIFQGSVVTVLRPGCDLERSRAISSYQVLGHQPTTHRKRPPHPQLTRET